MSFGKLDALVIIYNSYSWKFFLAWHKSKSIKLPVRIKLTNKNLLVLLNTLIEGACSVMLLSGKQLKFWMRLYSILTNTFCKGMNLSLLSKLWIK